MQLFAQGELRDSISSELSQLTVKTEVDFNSQLSEGSSQKVQLNLVYKRQSSEFGLEVPYLNINKNANNLKGVEPSLYYKKNSNLMEGMKFQNTWSINAFNSDLSKESEKRYTLAIKNEVTQTQVNSDLLAGLNFYYLESNLDRVNPILVDLNISHKSFITSKLNTVIGFHLVNMASNTAKIQTTSLIDLGVEYRLKKSLNLIFGYSRMLAPTEEAYYNYSTDMFQWNSGSNFNFGISYSM